jgi:hypothetical protein
VNRRATSVSSPRSRPPYLQPDRAFGQPWKRPPEGTVGGCRICRRRRRAKFPFSGPIVERPTAPQVCESRSAPRYWRRCSAPGIPRSRMRAAAICGAAGLFAAGGRGNNCTALGNANSSMDRATLGVAGLSWLAHVACFRCWSRTRSVR